MLHNKCVVSQCIRDCTVHRTFLSNTKEKMFAEGKLLFSSDAYSRCSVVPPIDGSVYSVSGHTDLIYPLEIRSTCDGFKSSSDFYCDPLSPPKGQLDIEYVGRIGHSIGGLDISRAVSQQLTPPPDSDPAKNAVEGPATQAFNSYQRGPKKSFLDRFNAGTLSIMEEEETKEILPIGINPVPNGSTFSMCNISSKENWTNFSFTANQYPKPFASTVLQYNTEFMRDWMPKTEELTYSKTHVINENMHTQGKSTRSITTPDIALPATQDTTAKKPKKRFQCPHCPTRCTNRGQLAGHIRSHTGERPFQCEQCRAEGIRKWFTRQEELTRHLLRSKKHQGEGNLPCDQCDRTFFRHDHLRKHKKTHTKKSERLDYRCNFEGCTSSYTRSDALSRHRRKKHNIQARPCQLAKVPQK